jgi:uncharacterized protein YjiS (DUF1127 family)
MTMDRILTSRGRPATPGLFRLFRNALAVRRQRLALEKLDDWLLKDVGIDRARAEAEAHRPVWDVPSSWLR